MQWHHFPHPKPRWCACSELYGEPPLYRIAVLSNGRFTISDSDADLNLPARDFATLDEAKEFCEQAEQTAMASIGMAERIASFVQGYPIELLQETE